ncbi:MAG: PQQ-dependent sugar dehydrogenase [Acidobacteriota bacterium]
MSFVALLSILAACSEPAARTAEAANTRGSAPALELVTQGLSSPVAITNAGDGSGFLYITLQDGRIVILDGTAVRTEPFLDIRSLVGCCGERGLLSAAFHPSYSTNGLFYVDYTDQNGDTVIARYQRSSTDPMRVDPTSAAILLRVAQPFPNHNGGQLQFGPDGYLYIGMGDGGSGGDPGNRAQNLGQLLGKLLRIDVDQGNPYAIPPDNPFVTRPDARPEIWAYGLRNPWRFSFDSNRNLFIGDVGQNAWEEIDFEQAGTGGGRNYGWRLMEGRHCFNPATNCSSPALVLPIAEYDHSLGCSVTGGYRYRGRFARLRSTYLYADYCSGRIWGATEASDGTWTSEELLTINAQITSFGEDEAGELYLADQGGKIFRLVDRAASRSRPVRP